MSRCPFHKTVGRMCSVSFLQNSSLEFSLRRLINLKLNFQSLAGGRASWLLFMGQSDSCKGGGKGQSQRNCTWTPPLPLDVALVSKVLFIMFTGCRLSVSSKPLVPPHDLWVHPPENAWMSVSMAVSMPRPVSEGGPVILYLLSGAVSFI